MKKFLTLLCFIPACWASTYQLDPQAFAAFNTLNSPHDVRLVFQHIVSNLSNLQQQISYQQQIYAHRAENFLPISPSLLLDGSDLIGKRYILPGKAPTIKTVDQQGKVTVVEGQTFVNSETELSVSRILPLAIQVASQYMTDYQSSYRVLAPVHQAWLSSWRDIAVNFSDYNRLIAKQVGSEQLTSLYAKELWADQSSKLFTAALIYGDTNPHSATRSKLPTKLTASLAEDLHDALKIIFAHACTSNATGYEAIVDYNQCMYQTSLDIFRTFAYYYIHSQAGLLAQEAAKLQEQVYTQATKSRKVSAVNAAALKPLAASYQGLVNEVIKFNKAFEQVDQAVTFLNQHKQKADVETELNNLRKIYQP